MESSPKKPRFQGDKHLSKFIVDINMNANQATSFMRGYSKFVGKNEAMDPAKSLHGFVSRLIRNGYLEKSYFMQFKTNAEESYSEILVELTPQTFHLHGAAKLYLPLEKTLVDVYELRKKNIDYRTITNQYQTIPKTQEKTLFLLDQGLHKTEADLVKHCQKLINEFNFSRSRVEGFYWEYRKHFSY